MKIGLTETIQCAHLIEGHPKCGEMHGHSYKVEVTLEGSLVSTNDPDAFNGMLVDFGELKKVIRRYDHKCLNNFISLPTAEMFTLTLCLEISDYLEKTQNDLVNNITVRVYETSTSWAEQTINRSMEEEPEKNFEDCSIEELARFDPSIKREAKKLGIIGKNKLRRKIKCRTKTPIRRSHARKSTK